MLDRPTHPSMKVHILYAALRVQVCASLGSLYMWDLNLFSHSNVYQLHNRLLSKNYTLCHFSTEDIIKSLNFYSIRLIYFFTFLGFLFANHKGTSVDSYWSTRGRNNPTCVKLYITFNLAVAPLSD